MGQKEDKKTTRKSRPEEPATPSVPEPIKPEKGVFPVVGLGASAGGLKSLQQFFAEMTDDSGMAFVVILHLSPDHESYVAEILQNSTKMLVTQVTERIAVEPNRVYVIPPSKHLSMQDGHIALSEPARERGRNISIDLFFRTLADTHNVYSACIVLSGTGSDGSVGLKRVKEQGGICLAQEPREAEFDSMPRNAISTGMVDFVLPVAEMPEKLLEIWRNASQISLPAEAVAPIRDESEAVETVLRDVLEILRSRTGHDFTHYKRATVLRRIERRMQVVSARTLPAYRDYLLRETLPEAQLLLKDLLIGVTNYYRDRGAFDALEREVIPLLFQGKSQGNEVRVWVTACATGEEAYSVAILLLEHAAKLSHPPAIQIFASDIDDQAIAIAREGSYPEAIEVDVTPTRLRQFFTKEPGGYRINKEVRERILFTDQDLIKDPPFSRLDLITCRNLLIYLSREVQEKAFELFHFALRPGGFLFLGSSESADGRSALFTPIDIKSRIFRANVVTSAARPLPVLPLEPHPRDRAPMRSEGAAERKHIAFSELHQKLLEQYAPPSLIVNSDHEIVHLSDHVGRYIQPSGGELSTKILKLILPELRLELRTALFQAMETGKSIEARRVRLVRGGHTSYVNMIVRPVPDAEAGGAFYLIIIEEVEEILGTEGKDQQGGESDPILRLLEQEVHRLKEQLQRTVEQYETTVEELKSSNEEHQSTNEELRSTAEELETSKEEVQSVNEELRTVNEELKFNVDDLRTANNHLQNLISSTDIATIFLDRSLRIRLFTPPAIGIFNLIPADEGRELTDITHRLDYPNLAADAEEVLRRFHKIEREVEGREGQTYLARLTPYRTNQDRIEGVVVTFIDITERKRAEEELRLSNQNLERRVSERTFELSKANDTLQREIEVRQQSEAGRTMLLRRLVHIQEEEKRHLSRELHDQLGQQVTALNINLELLMSQFGEAAASSERMKAVKTIVRHLDDDLDFLAWKLRPVMLDDLGLFAAVDAYIKEWSFHNNIEAQFYHDDFETRLTSEIEINLYRIVQEALNNVAKHAEAKSVSVVIQRRQEMLFLIIEDDGKGFEGNIEGMPAAKKLGLKGMQERAELIGGTIEIESPPGKGTTIILRLPLPATGKDPQTNQSQSTVDIKDDC
jgi:two-component system CheB/CheR fusion protein